MPTDFASKEAEELDGEEFYEQLKKVRVMPTLQPCIIRETMAKLLKPSERQDLF